MAVVFDDFDAQAKDVLGFSKWPPMIETVTKRRLYLRQRVAFKSKGLKRGDLERLQQLEQLERLERLQRLEQLERLERLQQLQQLERLQQLSFSAKDYRDVEIKPNSVVYCDIPYKGTADYLNSFDHKAFYEWAMTRDFPVYVSEYNIDDPRFKLVYTVDKRSMLSNDKSVGNMSEKLYWNGVGL
jgi:hypothetical protein